MRCWLLLYGAALLSAGSAFSEPSDFTHLVSTARMERGELDLALSEGLQRGVGPAGAPAPGSGLGGGAYTGVGHLLSAYFRPFDPLTLGLQQEFRQLAVNDLRVGVWVPEARWLLTPSWAVQLRAVGQARLRLNARRGSTYVLGASASRLQGRWDWLGTIGYEHGLDSNPEQGGRYELGASYRWSSLWSFAAEAWGVWTATPDAPFEFDLHLGPSVRVTLGRCWVSGNLAPGVRLQAGTFTDLAATLQVGIGI
jgi:hypothetical protein